MAKPAARPGPTIRKLADRSTGARVSMLVAPPEAVMRLQDGSVVVNPDACERRLVNPDTPGYEHESWPLAGIEFVDDPAASLRIPTNFVDQARAEGWLSLDGETVVTRPGGAADDPWRKTHTFHHADAIVFHTVSGDVRYRVTENPDKQHVNREGEAGEVWHFYDCELEA